MPPSPLPGGNSATIPLRIWRDSYDPSSRKDLRRYGFGHRFPPEMLPSVAKSAQCTHVLQHVQTDALRLDMGHMVGVVAFLIRIPVGWPTAFLADTKIPSIAFGTQFEEFLTFQASRSRLRPNRLHRCALQRNRGSLKRRPLQRLGSPYHATAASSIFALSGLGPLFRAVASFTASINRAANAGPSKTMWCGNNPCGTKPSPKPTMGSQ